ncbi:MAG TPA: hypothetical protein DEF61_03935 [Firmicutes bacterium]|nr:hypothetical protein [Bacillota bacterium]
MDKVVKVEKSLPKGTTIISANKLDNEVVTDEIKSYKPIETDPSLDKANTTFDKADSKEEDKSIEEKFEQISIFDDDF